MLKLRLTEVSMHNYGPKSHKLNTLLAAFQPGNLGFKVRSTNSFTNTCTKEVPVYLYVKGNEDSHSTRINRLH